MPKYSYDFHIHTCLSPCGDNDMTPNNIVNMALLAECDIIAVTDHNSCKNAGAVINAGEAQGLTVIPGMELCTSEEAHIVCLFETLDGAMEFDKFVYNNMAHVKNKAEIFGEQRIMDSDDNIKGYEENLLLVSSFVSVNNVVELTARYGGVAYPAHIDRDSFSVISTLGVVPLEANFKAVELTYKCSLTEMKKTNPEIEGMYVFRSSDAHYLETLAQEKCKIELPEKSAESVINFIRNLKISSDK